MTDSSALIANKLALTSDVHYSLKPSVVRCRGYRASIPSLSKNLYIPGDPVVCSIPCRRNCFLDTQNSYIRFTVINKEAAIPYKVDSTGNSFINRLDIYHGLINGSCLTKSKASLIYV
jgi:hypothetical protein